MAASSSAPGYTFEALSHAVLGACVDAQRQLGAHCMEVDYQRALEIALAKHGLQFQREAEIPVVYDGVTVTTQRVDFVIWGDTDEILLEIKAARQCGQIAGEAGRGRSRRSVALRRLGEAQAGGQLQAPEHALVKAQ